MKDERPLTTAENDAVDVRDLSLKVRLCCEDGAPCSLCLLIDTGLYIYSDKEMEDEDHSGLDQEDSSKEIRNLKGVPYILIASQDFYIDL